MNDENNNNRKIVVDAETATAEINDWLETIDFDPADLENEEGDASKKPFFDIILKHTQRGVLEFNEDGTIKHNLIKPVKKEGGEVVLESLHYDCDIAYGDFQQKLKGTDPQNGEERLSALVAAITKQQKGILSRMKMIDTKISHAIAVFCA